MLEAWICKEEPSVKLVVPAGGSIPIELGRRDWTLEGPFDADPDVARKVAEKGFHFFNAWPAVVKSDGLQDAPSSADPRDFK